MESAIIRYEAKDIIIWSSKKKALKSTLNSSNER